MAVTDPDALADLEEERDFLLRSLDDLEREHEAGDVDDDDYATLRDDYTARAATVLRAIEERRPVPPPPAPRRRWRSAAIVAAVVAAAGVSGLTVAWSSDERGSGDTITGEDVTTDDARDLLLQAQFQIDTDPVAALQTYDRVLALEPDNVEALTYRGWVLYLGTVEDEGLASIERALELDPGYLDAHAFRGLIRRRSGDVEGAMADFRTVLDGDPAPDLEQLVAAAYQEAVAASQGTPATATPGSTTGSTGSTGTTATTAPVTTAP